MKQPTKRALKAIIHSLVLVSALGAVPTGHAALSISPVVDAEGATVQATLKNERVKIEFITATRAGKASVRPKLYLKSGGKWIETPLDPSAESYQVVAATKHMQIRLGKGTDLHPTWIDAQNKKNQTSMIWKAGVSHEAIAKAATQVDGQRVKLLFHELDVGSLEAEWELKPGEASPRISLTLKPSAQGQFSLGYFLFKRAPMKEVQHVLVPMFVNERRFPSNRTYTYLQAQTPTPLSLMETKGMAWSVSGDPDMIPYEFPDPNASRYGLQIRGPAGQVHPSIFGPIIGRPDARRAPGQPLTFSFRVLVQAGDWYGGYRTVANEVFGFKDYRKNTDVSLTDAMLNMIDLYMDDEHGGWWDKPKAFYQIESHNSGTQSSPMTGISLYRLTGDREIYRRRALPILEYSLSRSGPHFSHLQKARLNCDMNGPISIFGATVYGGIWEMMNRRTPAFREVALPKTEPRFKEGMSPDSHFPPFSEWLGKYLMTGDQASLDRAKAEADRYIAKSIVVQSDKQLPLRNFFLMQYTPAWESLLALYEATGEKRYLDAAARGARRAMTGFWTQPMPPDGNVTIHPGGRCRGDKMHLVLEKGTKKSRLGWPLKADATPEKQVEAWTVSPAGLGFEQPSTYTYPNNGGRMIFQAPWTPWFLRLAHYTGDKDFETHARNAVVGRWGNYPGYYYTTFTDIMQSPDFPLKGPDMSFIYYHHLPVHLSWTMDYLVSDAHLLSEGAITFPGLRQFGYAFFDYRMYGHAPGLVMGEKDAWLWLKRGLVELDNPQLNYLTAHNGKSFFVILMNQSHQAESAKLTLHPAQITGGKTKSFDALRVLAGDKGRIPLAGSQADIAVPPRGLTVLAVDGLDISIPAHRKHAKPEATQQPGIISIDQDGMRFKGAAIQLEPGWWDAYIWSEAGYGAFKKLTLNWKHAGQTGSLTATSYPYEFSIPVHDGPQELSFVIEGVTAQGKTFKTAASRIGVAD